MHTDKNLYAYCDNNPVVRADGSGEFWHIVVGAVVGAAISATATVVTNVFAGKEWHDGLLMAALSGAASGALGMTGVTWAGLVGGNAAISMAASTIEQVTENGGFENFDVRGVLIDGAFGAMSGFVGGKGDGTEALMNIGVRTVRRTANAVTHHGLSAGIAEAGKAFAYYNKMTRSFYWDKVVSKVPWSIIQEVAFQAIPIIF